MITKNVDEMTESGRWEALKNPGDADSVSFIYAVTTTGIFCRPGCSSRLPRRENVRFFDTWQDAQAAGFRPCKRCRPDQPSGQAPHDLAILLACHTLESAEDMPSLADLARSAGLSPFHFQRVFRQVVGVTPRQYSLQKRLERVRGFLKQDNSVTEAAYHAGYGSSSSFYSQASDQLGMNPRHYQKGGEKVRIRYGVVNTYLGWMLVAVSEQGICAIDLGDSAEALETALRRRFPRAVLETGAAEFHQWVEQVQAYLEAPARSLDLPLDIQGTAFQRRVWLALREIPAGSTRSYAEVATQIGSPKAARAVAQACASNQIAVVVPCHRVVRSDGQMGGYRWGVERKHLIQQRERESSSWDPPA